MTTRFSVSGAVLAVAAILAPSSVLAHSGMGEASGTIQGLMHPVSGLDHVAAMVAVGLLAAQRGGRSLWSLPLSFLAAMALGSALAVAGLSLPFVEPAICASVIVLGMLIAASVRLSPGAVCLLVGFCALFHGHAHGTEMPLSASGAAYALGFLFSTSLLHGAGILAGSSMAHLLNSRYVRYAGGIATVCGFYLVGTL